MEEERIDEIKCRLMRYVDEYGWNWSFARKLINDFFGTDYTMKQLRIFYAKAKAEAGQ